MFIIGFTAFSYALSSCASSKKVVYFQDLQDTSKIYLQQINEAYEIKIQPDDILEIIVSSINPEATAAFNLGSGVISTSITSPATGKLNAPANNSSPGYLVNKEGRIDFPVLGKMQVGGYTTSQLKDTLERKLDTFLINPIVNVRLLNYKVTVLGEVEHPATYTIPSERLTVIDAIGMAGDLTIYGKRENILLIREENGQRKFIRLNLNSSDIFKSPYYYLKQNDVVYVEPNKTRTEVSASALQKTSLIIATLTLLTLVYYRVK
jgi:polysaccharide export outer membrane protein